MLPAYDTEVDGKTLLEWAVELASYIKGIEGLEHMRIVWGDLRPQLYDTGSLVSIVSSIKSVAGGIEAVEACTLVMLATGQY